MRRYLDAIIVLVILTAGLVAAASAALGGADVGPLDWARFGFGPYYSPPPQTGAISGVVTNREGDPVEGALVYAYSDSDDNYGPAITGPDGSYSLDGLATAQYYVSIWHADYVTQYYNNSADVCGAEWVDVTVGEVKTLDFALDRGGTISGVVTDAQGNPIAGAEVWADDGCTFPPHWSTSGPDGSYAIIRLAAGQYLVSASAPDYLYQYYDNTRDYNQAAPVAVAYGENTGGIDFVLKPGGVLTGVVTNPEGNPVEGAEVDAYSISGNDYGSVVTGPDGSYRITGLGAASYHVSVWHPDYVPEYYNNAYDDCGAAPVDVAEGEVKTLDFALSRGGTISGVVSDAHGNPIAGAEVGAWSYNECGGWPGWSTSGPDGSYTITLLGASQYRVEAGAQGYLTQFYSSARDYDQATPVTVVDGLNTGEINFSLDEGGSISGVVTDRTGHPINGAWVYADSYSGGYSLSAVTGPDGSYRIGGLVTDDYRVGVWAEGFTVQYYDGAANYDDATLVAVIEGEDTPSINFHLWRDSVSIAVDADITNGSGPCDPIDAESSVPVGESYKAAICVSGLPRGVAGFQFNLLYDDTLTQAPEISCPTGDCLDNNPDANAGATTWGDSLGDGWNCNIEAVSPPTGDVDPQTGPNHGVSSIICMTLGNSLTLGDNEDSGVLAVVQLNAGAVGSSSLTLANVEIVDFNVSTMGSCDDVSSESCSGAVVNQTMANPSPDTGGGTPTPLSTPGSISPPNTGPGDETATPTPIDTATPTSTPLAGPGDSTSTPTPVGAATPMLTPTTPGQGDPTSTSTPIGAGTPTSTPPAAGLGTSTPTPNGTATATATPTARGDAGAHRIPTARPTDASTPATEPPPAVNTPISEVKPAAVTPAAGAAANRGVRMPGAGTGGYLGRNDGSNSALLWLAIGATIAILAGAGVYVGTRGRSV